MVGGLFGVHNIDMGMCSSFARVFNIRKKKSFFFYIIFYGMVVVELPCFFHSYSSFFFTMCFYLFSFFFFFCIAWPLLSCKVGMAGHMCALGIS